MYFSPETTYLLQKLLGIPFLAEKRIFWSKKQFLERFFLKWVQEIWYEGQNRIVNSFFNFGATITLGIWKFIYLRNLMRIEYVFCDVCLIFRDICISKQAQAYQIISFGNISFLKCQEINILYMARFRQDFFLYFLLCLGHWWVSLGHSPFLLFCHFYSWGYSSLVILIVYMKIHKTAVFLRNCRKTEVFCSFWEKLQFGHEWIFFWFMNKLQFFCSFSEKLQFCEFSCKQWV